MQHSPTAAAFSTSFLLNHVPQKPLAKRIDYMIQGVIQQRDYESWVKKTLKKSSIDWLNSGSVLIQRMRMQFLCFPFLPGKTEAQVIWSGIVKRLFVAYFIGSISAKNIQICSRVSKL